MRRKHRYTLCSMMKDEGHSLIEWVAFHRMIGFDNICVYTNDCRDGTDLMLRRMQQMGLCQQFPNEVPAGKKPQPNALTLAQKNPEVYESDWVLVADVDEFLSIKCGDGSLNALIDAVPDDAWAIAVTWTFFGSNGLTDWRPGPVTQAYTRTAPWDFRKGWGVKTLFRPERDTRLGIHRPKVKGGSKAPDAIARMVRRLWVNGSGHPLPEAFSLAGWRSDADTLGRDLVTLNHYAVQSTENYLLRQLRGNVNNKTGKYSPEYFAVFDRNEVQDKTLADRAPELNAAMAQIRQDPQLAALEQQALAFHAQRMHDLRSAADFASRMQALNAAAAIPLDNLGDVLLTHHLPKEWRDRIAEWQAQGIPDKVIAGAFGRHISKRS